MPFESSGVLSDSGFNNSPLFGNDNTFGGGGGVLDSFTQSSNSFSNRWVWLNSNNSNKGHPLMK